MINGASTSLAKEVRALQEKRYIAELAGNNPKYLMYDFQKRKYFFQNEFMRASKCASKAVAEDMINMYRHDQKDWDTEIKIRTVLTTYEILDDE